jgi:hypothetical protein
MKLDLALTAQEKKHELVILHEGQKSPMFRNWQDKSPDAMELRYWLAKGKNYGIKTRGLVVADKDAVSAEAFGWLRKHGLYRTEMVVETRKGLHLYYRLAEDAGEVRKRIRFLGMPLDLITGENFVVGPGSTVKDFTYTLREGKRMCGREELLSFPSQLLSVPSVVGETRASVCAVCNVPEARARLYLDKVAVAEQGKGGSRAVFIAALKCLTLASGDEQKAWEYLVYFNRTRCLPPFDEEIEAGPDSLRRKLHEARKCWKPG